jgi:hypothetical protein
MLFGGCDISGMVGDTSLVVLTGGQVNGNIYAGGNGFYYYKLVDNTGVSGTHYEVYTDESETEKLADSVASAPISRVSRVDLLGGQVGIDATHIAEVFGGGFGQPTNTTGNVIVNVGPATATSWTGLPVVYGNVYGGSAFGSVNYVEGGTTSTTNVNFLNGSLHGMLFGGGLGRKEEGSLAAIEAKVYGKVFVTISNATQDEDECFIDLRDADIYGCNNQNGSPQDTVFVDVYQTYHIPTDSSSYVQPNAGYAIHQVFGGGNQSDYTVGKKNYVHIHGCENTIRRLFGGGNAAAVYGVNLTIDGGRFDQVFGGGNGESGVAANIGLGGITILLGGGRINALYNGSNEHGDVLGDIESNTFNSGCSDAVVIDHFMGSNQTEIIGDVTETIGCDSEMRYVNLYCGSNVAQIYGNINLTIAGGVFENVFGGSKGRLNDPELDDYASNIMDNPDTDEIEGHINLFISGGTVGNLFGACDVNGNVTGKITIIVQESDTCQLFIGNIYGGGRYTNYTPTNISNGVTEYSEHTPVIKILRATVGGHTNELPIIDEGDGDFEGNVYGGGCYGDVTSNPIVVIGDKDHPNDSPVTIEGNVYGGCKEGTVNGNTRIIIAPIPE